MESTAEMLQKIKDKEGLNNQELGDNFGVSRQQVAAYLKGSAMTYDTLCRGLGSLGYYVMVIPAGGEVWTLFKDPE